MPCATKRARHLPTVCAVTFSRFALSRFEQPAWQLSTIRALSASGREPRQSRTQCSSCSRSSRVRVKGFSLARGCILHSRTCAPSARTPLANAADTTTLGAAGAMPICLEVRNLCLCTDGRPRPCKPLKLRAFAAARTCWPREEVSSRGNALATRTIKGLIFKDGACRVRLTVQRSHA